MRHTRNWLCALFLGLTGCGYGSVNPILLDNDMQYDSTLLGTWWDSINGVRAVVTAAGRGDYDVLYTDEDGKPGRFHAQLGKLGSFRALDLEPVDLPDDLSPVYASLFVPLHALVIVDSIGETVVFRAPQPDAIRAFLAQNPEGTAHHVLKDVVVLTGSPAEVNRFFGNVLTRPGMLGEHNVWRRRSP